jgi:hypothetical protein
MHQVHVNCLVQGRADRVLLAEPNKLAEGTFVDVLLLKTFDE